MKRTVKKHHLMRFTYNSTETRREKKRRKIEEQKLKDGISVIDINQSYSDIVNRIYKDLQDFENR